jgi:acetaldehyde dehydrogenase
MHSFIGHNENSKGLLFCKSKYPNVTISTDSIEFILKHHQDIDILIDCTNANQHVRFNHLFKKCAFKVIDMTPSKIGLLTVPDLIGEKDISDHQDFNLISCGGQTSIPIAHTLSEYIPDIEYLEVVSSISSKSAGPATRKNLDEYIETTSLGLSRFTGIDLQFIKVILIVNPAIPEIDMQTSIYLKCKSEVNITEVSEKLNETIKRVNNYVPGYRIMVPFTCVGDKYIVSVKVSGCGDFLPSYAGNLDIINCACIRLAEKFV